MIRQATLRDSSVLAELAVMLWPHHGIAELKTEIEDALQGDKTAFFLAFDDGITAGFAQCQLRFDYVEGTDSSPVGYLEGIYVAEAYRNRGIARSLLHSCEDWAREKGCSEFASDCELGNTQSCFFHLNAGFQEANRIICFTKKL